jgi:alanine racemase
MSLLSEYHLDHPPSLPLRPTRVEVAGSALRHNLFELARVSGVRPKDIIAVVKANGYGHGLLLAARCLADAGAGTLAVGFVEEGVCLRREGLDCPILVLGGLVPEQIPVCLENRLDMTISSHQKAEELATYLATYLATLGEAGSTGQSTLEANVHVKIDVDMRRIGLRPSGLPALLERLAAIRGVRIRGVYSHLACAGQESSRTHEAAVQTFTDCRESYNQLHGTDSTLNGTKLQGNSKAPKSSDYPSIRWHLANSAAALSSPKSVCDAIRPGLSLYGLDPMDHHGLIHLWTLKPALQWKSQVVYFKVVHAGEGLSYGHCWKADKQTRIVTVPVGYGDGYARGMSGKASVLIRGNRYPVVGTICMDQIMVDIGPDGEAYNGDEVVLIGSQGEESISIEDLASWQNTISYEVLTRISDRVPRVFIP